MKSREGKKKEGHHESPSAANSHTSLEVCIEKAKSGEYLECIILFGKDVFRTCTHTIAHSGGFTETYVNAYDHLHATNLQQLLYFGYQYSSISIKIRNISNSHLNAGIFCCFSQQIQAG